SVEATTDEEFDRAIALNLKSTFLACRAVIPAMRKAKRGKIVNVSSEASLLGEAESFLYSAGKSGVNRLTESLARELNTANIQVNCVMPRILDTPANRKAMSDSDFSSWVKTDQVARVILWLCSEDADPITGSAIPVYGGPCGPYQRRATALLGLVVPVMSKTYDFGILFSGSIKGFFIMIAFRGPYGFR